MGLSNVNKYFQNKYSDIYNNYITKLFIFRSYLKQNKIQMRNF